MLVAILIYFWGAGVIVHKQLLLQGPRVEVVAGPVLEDVNRLAVADCEVGKGFQ